jgi:hypothetical protein
MSSLKLTRISNTLPLRVLDDRGAKISKLQAMDLRPSPVRVCLACNLGSPDLRPCSQDHLRRNTPSDTENADRTSSKGKGKSGATKSDGKIRTLKERLFPNRAEHNFQVKLSSVEDEAYLEKRKANPATRMLTSILKAERAFEQSVQGTMALSALQTLGSVGGGAGSAFMSYDGALRAVDGAAKTLHNRVTPAGAYHTSLKFGPLIIESGVDAVEIRGKKYSTKRGILVAPRFSPTLLADKRYAAILLYDEEDRPELGETNETRCFNTACNIYLTEDDKGRYKRRRIELKSWPSDDRSSLACMKIVCGAAFSGYPDVRQPEELATISVLVDEAVAFQKASYRSKTATAQRKALCEAADRILVCLKGALEQEVNKYLARLAKIFLDPQTKISWSPFANNCQRLVDKLLQGKDFEYFFPRLPKSGLAPVPDVA